MPVRCKKNKVCFNKITGSQDGSRMFQRYYYLGISFQSGLYRIGEQCSPVFGSCIVSLRSKPIREPGCFCLFFPHKNISNTVITVIKMC